MKRILIAAAIACAVVMGSGTARASAEPDKYEDGMMHPLRLAYYAAHPVGFAIEWLVGRPFHYIISRPYLDAFFGYHSLEEEGTYRRLGERF